MMVETERRRRLPLVDRTPESTAYHDTGCSAHHSCLSCPLERCVYDEPEGGKGAAQRARDEEIFRLYGDRGPDIQSLAMRFGVSRRTIHRVVQRMKQDAEVETLHQRVS